MDDKKQLPENCNKKKQETIGKRTGVSDELRGSIQSKVAQILKREGINRSALAQRMNVSNGRITQIFASETLSLAKLEEIANALGYEVEVSFVKTSDKI